MISIKQIIPIFRIKEIKVMLKEKKQLNTWLDMVQALHYS